MKHLLGLLFLTLFFSCSKEINQVENQSLTNAQRQARIEAAFGTSNSNRIAIATLKLLTNSASSKLKEVIAIDKVSGLKSFVYLEVKTDNTAARMGITSGWMLYNDGCFYHGTLFTADKGDTLFVADSNPFGDNYVGNEPKCMTYDKFDSFC